MATSRKRGKRPLQNLQSRALKAALLGVPESLPAGGRKNINIGKRISLSGKNMMTFEGGFLNHALREEWPFANYVTATSRLS